MKLGIIADVHADIEGLQLALDLLTSEGVAQIVCAGDLVGKGPNGNAVIQLIQARSILCIAGNHEQEALNKKSLALNSTAYLQQLPNTLNLTLENKRVLIAHGAPWSDLVYIFPTTERHVFRRIAREAHADVVILGHTHVPMSANISGLFIFNPGSVCGTHTSGSRTCGILTLPTCSFQVFEIVNRQEIQVPHIQLIR